MVNTAIEKNKEHITLKEAAELSGYSSDYLGQLIRKGKLHGEQVYSNVAWVTTRKDITAYLEKAKGGDTDSKPAVKQLLDKHLERSMNYFLYGVIALLSACILILFYIFVANIEGGATNGIYERVSVSIQDYE